MKAAKAALDDYELREVKGVDPDAIDVAVAVRTALGKLKGFLPDRDGAVGKGRDGVRLFTVRREPFVDVWLAIWSSAECIARVHELSNAHDVQEAVAELARKIPAALTKLRGRASTTTGRS